MAQAPSTPLTRAMWRILLSGAGHRVLHHKETMKRLTWSSGSLRGCALSETESNTDLGRAIDTVNGEEAYDDDFVTKYL
jgi:hypothetical protein